ncbi:MAG: SDR family NAD(P)-dependent oxidoreductase, partial [Shimia sp.]
MDLTGKIILVTGAERGIGAAVTRACESADGLMLTDRDPIVAELTCAVEVLQADLAQPNSAKAIFDHAIARFGRIDGLVNAAGLTTRGDFETPDAALFDHLFAVNTRAPYLLMSHVIRHLKARSAPGAIVNIQSMNAHGGAPDLAIYAATKGALQTLT